VLIHTDKLTPWSRVLLGKLTVTQLVNKFPAFYGTRKSITVFIRAASGAYPEPDKSGSQLPTLFH